MIDPWVKANFDISLMEGTFYELAYHDYTQPRPMCGCERSVKSVNADAHPPTISDYFSIQCFGKDYPITLHFNETEPAMLNGSCGFFAPFGTRVCPDYVIDVGTRTHGEPYPWVLEFQCVEHTDGSLMFAGINFYSKEKSNKTLTEMLKVAEDHGLHKFIEGGWPSGLKVVNHSNCTYPEPPAVEKLKAVAPPGLGAAATAALA
eukprot:CAMPEP_0178418862 /NCGR_PEP_ID=MMETSP0689_2-20121128/25308_1 /TAXON_ID=160604 /ORGANISM="Amphidinium massartii, Strain CS-259" /LENGTH=203 /DNA_ID=CAMNT_0020040271 /DNA_START=174 /DNA_END=781 /DNA_ORIENTATION=+